MQSTAIIYIYLFIIIKFMGRKELAGPSTYATPPNRKKHQTRKTKKKNDEYEDRETNDSNAKMTML